MALSPAGQIDVARMHGVVIPDVAYRACGDTSLPFAVGCALLMQESSGGRNVWGSDPTWMVGYGTVTECAYAVYKAHRKRFGMQGVGPVQLTWWELQDAADTAGGCWDPYANCVTGFRRLRDLRDSQGDWWAAFAAYNGSGPAAGSYADQMMIRRAEWRAWLGY